MPPIIEAHGLTKNYGEVRALDGLDLEAQSGHVTALLGPNGAGKTTFVSAVATLLRPDGGEIRVAGIDACANPKRVREIIGLAGQYASVEPAMTGLENLAHGRPALRAQPARRPHRRRRGARAARPRATPVTASCATYSGGMRRRLDLGASLVGRPQLLLLDEPTTGLDPRSRMDLWEAIRGLVADGTDVLLTTQYLEEADQLARDIVIIDHGRVIAAGTPDELKDRAGRNVIEVRPRSGGDLPGVEEALAKIGCETPHIDMDTQRVSARGRGRSRSAPRRRAPARRAAASRSTTSACADPPSTRCSSPSPASTSSPPTRTPTRRPIRRRRLRRNDDDHCHHPRDRRGNADADRAHDRRRIRDRVAARARCARSSSSSAPPSCSSWDDPGRAVPVHVPLRLRRRHQPR